MGYMNLHLTVKTLNIIRFHDCSCGRRFTRHVGETVRPVNHPSNMNWLCAYRAGWPYMCYAVQAGESSPPCDGQTVFRANELITIPYYVVFNYQNIQLTLLPMANPLT